MAISTSPSFFKVILDPSSPYLQLPPAFVKKYLKNRIPSNPNVKIGTLEFTWNLKIKEIEGNYCFAHGWSTVVKETQLGFGEFLVFWLIDPLTFQVSIYKPNGCQKDLSFNVLPDCPTKPRSNSGLKNVKIEDHDDEDDDDDNEDDDDDEEDDDDDDDTDVTFGSIPDEHPCFQKIISEKSNKYTMRLPIKFVDETGVGAKTSIVVMDPQGREWVMGLAYEKCRNRNYYLSTGWSIFREHHRLGDGDICSFTLNKPTGVLTLTQVIKKSGPPRKRGRPRLEKPAAGPEAVKRRRGRPPLEKSETVKRKRGRPPLKKPCGGGGSGEGEVKLEDEVVEEVVKTKRGRGRPPRVAAAAAAAASGRGRPRVEECCVEVKIEEESIEGGEEEVAVKRKRGRPPRRAAGEEEAVKRKRGRPPNGKGKSVIYF